MSETIATTTMVTIRCADPEGNDPWEADARLPLIPSKGMSLEVWIQEDQSYACRQEWLEVKDVILCTWAPERIEVWVSTDGHSGEDMRRIFQAIERNEQP